MDQDTIQKIAQEVAKHLPNYSWQLLAVQVMLTLFAFGAGIFCGVHLRTGGKNLAISQGSCSRPTRSTPRQHSNGRGNKSRNWAGRLEESRVGQSAPY